MKADKFFCKSERHPDGDGSILILPSKDEEVIVLSWSTHKLEDGRVIGIGRNYNGIVAIHIPEDLL